MTDDAGALLFGIVMMNGGGERGNEKDDQAKECEYTYTQLGLAPRRLHYSELYATRA